MSFGAIVNLYRLLGMPAIEGGSFKVDVDASDTLISAVASTHEADGSAFRELLIDGQEYFQDDDIPSDGERLEFTFALPADSDSRFYTDVNDLINTSGKICKGQLPNNFYIRSLNYFNEDEEPPKEILTLISICKVIELLSNIAHYHDQKTVSDSHKLVFINPDEHGEKSAIVVETSIDVLLLNRKPLNYAILEDLASSSLSSDPHLVAKKGVFWSSLAEFSSKIDDQRKAFENLIINWESFLDLYQKNLETYLSGFAFHKAKREVAQAELDLASQFSKVIGDITGKLLAIPISFGAILAIDQARNIFEQVLVCAALFVSSLLIVGVIDNQQRQLGRISHAKNVVLDSFIGKKERYPKDLGEAVTNMVLNLRDNENNLRYTLYFFRCLAWLPFIFSVVVVLAINSVE